MNVSPPRDAALIERKKHELEDKANATKLMIDHQFRAMHDGMAQKLESEEIMALTLDN